MLNASAIKANAIQLTKSSNMKIFVVAYVLALAISATNAANLNAVSRAAFPEGRMINGVDAAPGDAPFIVSLRSSLHFCGGSIIDEHWVLTAAHCLVYSQFSVVAGLHNRSDESNVQIRKVTSLHQYVVHSGYPGRVGPNDIGLIYIPEPFNLNAMARDGSVPVSKVALPSGKFEQTGAGKLFGWGRDSTGYLSKTLQQLDVNIIGYEKCKPALPSDSKLAEGNICSYNVGTTDGACNGDSGGPLVRTTSSGYELVGIVSWGYTPCATTEYPSVYTWTTPYKSWIQEEIANF